MSIAFIIFAIIVLTVSTLVAVSILYGVNGLLKIRGNTFKLSALVFFLTTLSGLIFSIIGIFVTDIRGACGLLSLLIPWAVGYYLYRHYFQTSIGRFLAVFCICYLITIPFLIVAVFVRANVLQPIMLTGTTMAPQFSRGDYILVEMWDRGFNKGDVVLASIPCTNSSGNCFALMRVSAMPGDITNGLKVADDERSLSVDAIPEKSATVNVKAIIGKPLLNLGQTGI